MQFQLFGEQQINATNPQTWIKLCESNDDFQFVMNRDLLRQMMSGFQQATNELWKKYYFDEQKKRIEQMEGLYAEVFTSGLTELKKKKELFDKLVVVNKSTSRSFGVTLAENERHVKTLEAQNQQLASKKARINEIERQIEHLSVDMEDLLVTKAQETHVAAKKITDLVLEHNKMIETYDGIFRNYNEYKDAYERLKYERDNFNSIYNK